MFLPQRFGVVEVIPPTTRQVMGDQVRLEEIVGVALGWTIDNISALAGNLIRQMSARDTNSGSGENDSLQFINDRPAAAVHRAKQAIFESPEKGTALSIKAVKVTIDELLKACDLDSSEVRPLEDYLLDYGMEGWTKFWEEEVDPRCPGTPSLRLERDPWSNTNSVLLRAWLVKLGRPDPHPDSYHKSLADFDAWEVWIRAEGIAILLDLSIDHSNS